MRAVVIGGTGHIGTYLVPSLVRAGHDVVVVSRGSRQPHGVDPTWREVELVACDRVASEKDGRFGSLIASLQPDAVVDLMCFTPAQAEQLVLALDGQHVVHTGSVWSYGPSTLVPTPEDAPKNPYGKYGVDKLAIERYLMGQDRVRTTVVHPGHISGPGWMPIGPAGNLEPAVLDSLRADGSCLLPDRGGGVRFTHSGLGTGPSQRRLLETRAPIREWHRRTTTLFRTLASPGSRGGRLDQTDRRRNADA